MSRKLISMLLIFIMAFAIPTEVFAIGYNTDLDLKYLNIGDSIAYGLSADEGFSYFDLYEGFLGEYGLDDMWMGGVNMGLPGLDSMELLEMLESTSPTTFTAAVASADVITISIGGNNLLTPVIDSVYRMYGLNIGDPIELLMGRVISRGETTWNANLAYFTESALSSDYPDLGWWLEERTSQFLEDWPAILDRIEDLNSDAQIIAMTLYNPIEEDDNKVLFDRYEELVKPMNEAMLMTRDRVMLAKVAKAFRKVPDAVAFKLTWTEGMPPVMVDPHPTTFGHSIIFDELLKLRNPMSFR